MRSQFFADDELCYRIPAVMTDGVIVTSYKEDAANSRRSLTFEQGEPVGITGVLQGHLIQ